MSAVEVINNRTYSRKTNKLLNVIKFRKSFMKFKVSITLFNNLEVKMCVCC